LRGRHGGRKRALLEDSEERQESPAGRTERAAVPKIKAGVESERLRG
jgi:hypothetical protein